MNGKTHSTPGLGPLTIALPEVVWFVGFVVSGEAVVNTGGDTVMFTIGGEGPGVVWFVVAFTQLEEQKPQLPWPPI